MINRVEKKNILEWIAGGVFYTQISCHSCQACICERVYRGSSIGIWECNERNKRKFTKTELPFHTRNSIISEGNFHVYRINWITYVQSSYIA